jgi:probable F420-dependent oxidoreductase
MRTGVSLPQREPGFGRDIGAITEFAQAAESMGYEHIRTGEHVLGANDASRPGWKGPYTHADLWHEPFVLFGYLAALTRTLEFATSIVILPQRQTALVAKQAAALDLVSGGRLRLGIGVGWNPVEFEALGEDFSTRGRRCEEQMEVMRALWTQELVTYRGRWDTINDAGLNPMPVQRPIPIWIGGGPGSSGVTSDTGADRVLRRIARMADGWFPSVGLNTGIREAISALHGYMRDEGRDVSEVGIEGMVTVADSTPQEWAGQASAWEELGATHLSVNTAGAGFTSPEQHIDALRRFKDAFPS